VIRSLFLWASVLSIPRRLLRRLHRPGDVLCVCTWCHRIAAGKKWVEPGTYPARRLKAGTTDTICPDCVSRLKEQIPQFRRAVADRR
jgi:hypothetical protein